MPAHGHMNFIGVTPRKNRLLVGGIAATFVLSGFMIWAIVGSPFSDSGQTALIGILPEETPDAAGVSPTPEPKKAPKSLNTGSINSLAPDTGRDSVRYYETPTGRAFSANLREASVSVLSDRKLSGFIRSWWLPDRPEVISAFDVSGTVEHRYYDYASDRVAPIGDAVTALAVSPDGKRIAFIDTENESSSLVVADPDGAAARVLMPTRAEEAELVWPRHDHVAMVTRREPRNGSDLTLISLDGTLRTLMTGAENLETAWSPDGRMLLYSSYRDGQGIVLRLLDVDNGDDISLGLATSAAKCAWHPNGRAITCGVPHGSSLARDIPAANMATTDDVISVDLESGGQTVVAGAGGGALVGVIEPLVVASGRYFAFVNLFDRKLHYLEL